MEFLRYSTLTGYEWQHPKLLLLLAAVPLVLAVRWALAGRRGGRVVLAPGPGQAPRALSPAVLLRFVPDVVLAAALALAVVALARPQRADQRLRQTGRGIDIVLAVDVSGSMAIQDLKPNRLEAAKRLAARFLAGRQGDRVGLVAFAGEAYSVAPLTTDYALLTENLRGLRLGLIADDGTAIGTALGVALNRLRESRARSRVCILLSDGENTAGALDPLLAARLAHAYGVRLYTVGLGQDGFVPFGQDSVTGSPRYVQTRLDETTMRQLAAAADGRFFRATDNAALAQVFREIDGLEKSDVRTLRYRTVRDFYRPYLTLAIALWLLWLLLKSTFLTSSITD